MNPTSIACSVLENEQDCFVQGLGMNPQEKQGLNAAPSSKPNQTNLWDQKYIHSFSLHSNQCATQINTGDNRYHPTQIGWVRENNSSSVTQILVQDSRIKKDCQSKWKEMQQRRKQKEY